MHTIPALALVAALLTSPAVFAQPAPAGKSELKQQPGLLALVEPRIAQLRDAGITQIVGRAGGRNNIQVLTRSGPAYARWPRGTTPVPFELYFNTDGTNAAFAGEFADKAKWAATMDAVIAAALKEAENARRNASRPRA